MSSTIFTKAERAEILQRCLQEWALNRRAYNAQHILDMPKEDVLAQVGVKVYTGLFYFRFKKRLVRPGIPYEEQAYQLALKTGHNELTDMIRRARRTRMDIDYSIPETLQSNLDSTIIIEDLLEHAARDMVGDSRAKFLLRSTQLNWDGGMHVSREEREVMAALNRSNGKQMRTLLDDLHNRVGRMLETNPIPAQKSDGVWRAAQRI